MRASAMRGVWSGTVILWLVCALVLISFIGVEAARADICLPGKNKSEYPTEQHLYFDLETNAAAPAGEEGARTVRARLSGSDKPPASLKIYPLQGKKDRSLLTVTVVPMINTDRETLELVASLHVTETGLSPQSTQAQFEEMAATVEEALQGWEKKLTLGQKEKIQRYGALNLAPDLDGIQINGVLQRPPTKVAFVSPVKNPIDLYDIAKGLESRLGQYGRLEREYNRLESSKLKDGLAALDKFDQQLALFDSKLTSEFESAVSLQRDVSSTKDQLSALEKGLAEAEAQQRETRNEPVPPLYVNVDTRKRSLSEKPGYKLFEDALQRAEDVDRSLYQTLLSNYDATTDQLYKKNLAKLEWLKEIKRKYKERTDRRRQKVLDEITQRVAGLEQDVTTAREDHLRFNQQQTELLTRLRTYYQYLTSNIGDDDSAPDIEDIGTGREAEDTLYDAMDWINNQQGYIEGQRARIDRELGQHIGDLLAIDGRLAVLARDIAERREQAGCWVIRALKKDDNDDLVGVLSEFNTLAGELNSAVSEASDRSGKLAYGQKIFTDSKLDWLEKFGEKIKILSKSAERITSWTGPAEKLLVLNQQFENKDPMFFVGVLEGAGDIAGKVPVIGSTIKVFLDYNAFLSKKILERGQMIHGELAQQALDLLLTSDGQRQLPPEYHLYRARDVRAAIETRLFSASDVEVQEAATEFQIKRIKHLLANGSKSRGLPSR